MVSTRSGTNTSGRSTFSARVQARMAGARRSQPRTWAKQYRPSDTSKRHRLHDDQPKEQRVVSYMRRT